MKSVKYKNFFVIGISGLLLSACGGGGGSQMDIGLNEDTKPLGKYVTIVGEAKNGDLMTIATDDGKKFSLDTTVPGISLNTKELDHYVNSQIGNRVYTNFTVSGTNYKDSKFGFVEDKALGDKGVLFSHGHLTKNMPQQGSAKYTGSSVFVDKSNNAITGKSDITANFGSKKISGVLSGNETDRQNNVLAEYNIKFNGDINGNTFTGKDASAKTNVDGRFYGGNANEVGGIFENKSENTKGAFGGVRKN